LTIEFQSRLYELMGPLSKAWSEMQACVADEESDGPEPADILKLLN